jgi:glycosyltransferase involved in cell wall biosynthesis
MPLFSVVIPTFNRIALLGATVESVIAQRFSDFEIIVVDDGSTDGTTEYLQTLGKKVRVFWQPNGGPGAARNLGARHACGTYLAFLDSDDLLFPWTLEVYRDAIYRYGEPSFVVGKPHVFWKDHERINIIPGAAQTERFVDYLASSDEWRWWGASSFVVYREAFSAVGGFAEDRVNGEDADLALRLGLAPGFVQVTSPATFAYRDHVESAMKDLKRTVAGAQFMVCAEQAGRYPGRQARAVERYRILTRNTRAVTVSCLKQGLWLEAWALYRATFGWNASLGRMMYLAAFPLLAITKAVTSRRDR